jgi:hypothetical protein
VIFSCVIRVFCTRLYQLYSNSIMTECYTHMCAGIWSCLSLPDVIINCMRVTSRQWTTMKLNSLEIQKWCSCKYILYIDGKHVWSISVIKPIVGAHGRAALQLQPVYIGIHGVTTGDRALDLAIATQWQPEFTQRRGAWWRRSRHSHSWSSRRGEAHGGCQSERRWEIVRRVQQWSWATAFTVLLSIVALLQKCIMSLAYLTNTPAGRVCNLCFIYMAWFLKML